MLGAIHIYRQGGSSLHRKQIALVQTFAAQAVIAMENARLITETREALDQQTATAEVLQVINSSPGDLAPVFDAMLEKAMRLCEASFGTQIDGENFSCIAVRRSPGIGRSDASAAADSTATLIIAMQGEDSFRRGYPLRTCRSGILPDERSTNPHGTLGRCARMTALGAFIIFRQEVRPCHKDRTVRTSMRSVIAMENARLITETQEALDQQTATAEVLQVINASPGDLGPVFNAILKSARGGKGRACI